jgi:predicted O-linked N-acetylglucosamine transferase (SPINDLY family)
LLAHHDRQAFEVFAYADVPRPDGVTERVASHVDVWRRTVGLSDEAMADLIRRDRIDILVDLTMHMAGNRMLLFARKPAPLQVTYLAYCSTTGLDTIDYRLSDPYLDPPSLNESYYSERTVRLPRTYWCYDPHPQSPQVNVLPASTVGYVTFGCLNNYCKISRPTLEAWRCLLLKVAGSRLIVYSQEGTHRQHFREFFAAEGIDPTRLQFVGRLPFRQHVERYWQIDIALDPFPYGGGTTTCDALWMGVPMVSIAGQTAVSRSGLSILSNVGLPELVARTPEQYVNTAAGLAADLPRLAALRATMRERMRSSPLVAPGEFARDVEAAYRQMWHNWCETRT